MAAYNLTLSPSTFISFRLLCNFSSDLRGRRINVQGYLNNELAVECSPFDIVNLGPIYIQQFSFVNRRDCPVSYTGGYTWNLVAGTTVFATSPMLTSLELYTVASPLPSLWASYGVSVNLLRQYAAPWATHTTKWVLADFYRFIVTRIFGGTFRYDTVIGDYHFLKPTSIISGLGGGFMLDEYFRDLEAAKVVAVNWYDLAGIVQIVHSLYPNYKNGAWIYMSKFGWITTTNIKGYGPCNNRFFENTTYNSDRIASVDPPQLPWPPGFRRRSPFANHAFILAPTATPNVSCVLDATGGPHIGNESLETYINTAINRATTYYKVYPTLGPGTTKDIYPYHRGITYLENGTSFSTPATPSLDSDPLTEDVLLTLDAVEDAMKRARVPHADPPRFSQVDPTGLKDLLERTMGAALTSEAVLPGEHRCEANWTFGSALGEVEVAVNVFDSHKAAVQSMRAALSLEGVGGYGIIFFVRDNVFIKMKGLPSSEKLGDIAGPIDAFLKEKEKDRNQVPAPPMEPGDLPPRQVQEKAGCMAASTDMAIVQLLEVDKANATFKLFAVAAGKADIHMVFAHESTLQTTTKKWKLKWLEMQMRNCK